MPRSVDGPVQLSKVQARQIWLRAQRLDVPAPFGAGPDAARTAVEHLGYVQIDTIHVVERCHHHILWSRIPEYRPADLHRAQTIDRSVFEYWTHALSFVPSRDFRFFLPAMKRHRRAPGAWFASVTPADLQRVLSLIRDGGPLTIRDIDDDVLVERDHAWASRKPSKRALQLAFFDGLVTISERSGMLKTYELTGRHFGWDAAPKSATEAEVNDYLLNRALGAQGIVSLDSICHLDAPRKAAIRKAIETRLRRGRLVPVAIDGAAKIEHWAEPAMIEASQAPQDPRVHILSPFDPLIIQRKRLKLFFDYDHVFEAYVPREKRKLGYFALPVLIGDAVVAAIDIKTDRAARRLIIQKWNSFGPDEAPEHRRAIEEALHRFERFQLPDGCKGSRQEVPVGTN